MICESINITEVIDVKRCTKCGELKLVSEFNTDPRNKNGLRAACRVCANAQQRAWGSNNKKHKSDVGKAYRKNSPRSSIDSALRHAVKRSGTENPVTVNEMMEMWRRQEGKCALSGISMVWNNGVAVWNSISIDQTNPKAGYTLDNVRLVCHCINSFRYNMTDGEFDEVIRKLFHHRGLSDS